MQVTSNVVPAAQTALNNAQQATWAQKQTALRALGARNGASATPAPTGFNLAGNSGTVNPLGVNISGNTGGSTTPKSLTMQQPSALPTTSQISGVVNPRTVVPNSQPYASLGLQTDSLMSGAGAKTPEQIAAATGQTYTPPGTTPPAGTTQPTTPPTTPPSYGGIVGSLVNTSQSNPLESGGAYAAYSSAIDNLNRLKSRIAETFSGIEQSGIPVEFQGGREASLSKQYASQLDAAQQAVNQAQQALGYGIQEQSTQQSGLTSAAAAAKPTVEGYGQTSFNPLTQSFGSQSGASAGTSGAPSYDPAQDAQNFGTAVMSGKMTYDQAVSSMGYTSVGKNTLDQAILKMGGNPLSLQAKGSATQSVIGTQSQQQAAYQSAHQQAQNLQSQLTDLIKKFGLNPNDLSAANAGLQTIARNTSSPQYQILSNYLADVASRYAQILTPTGGSQTDTTRGVATGMLNNLASGQSIIQVMNGLDQQAQAVIAGVSTTGGSTGGSSGTPNPWH